MSTTHGLNPESKAKIVSVSEEMEDNVFIDEAARQKNKETIDKYMAEIQDLDEKLEKIEQQKKDKGL